jgi:hypothetical protein
MRLKVSMAPVTIFLSWYYSYNHLKVVHSPFTFLDVSTADKATRRFEKITQFFKKEPKQSPSIKIFTFKLNLKVQNIYIEQLLKP